MIKIVGMICTYIHRKFFVLLLVCWASGGFSSPGFSWGVSLLLFLVVVSPGGHFLRGSCGLSRAFLLEVISTGGYFPGDLG